MLLLAKTEGHVAKLATEGIKQIRVKYEEKPLLDESDIIAMGAEALLRHDKSGKQFADYLCFLMYSGARCSEALQLKWSDVDWDNEQVLFRAANSKGEKRRLQFNEQLKNTLLGMKATAKGEFLFPSARTDKPVTSFKTLMQTIREALGITFHFHLTRHFFISQCVMKGIGFLTIAHWVGHKDTLLISRVYGHLNNSFYKEEAKRLDPEKTESAPSGAGSPQSSAPPSGHAKTPPGAIAGNR
jgi:integrase